MTRSDPAELAAQIEAAVRAVPGVTSVFGSGPLISNALAAATSALAGTSPAPRTVVRERESGVEVEVSIGVDAGTAAPDTLRLVHAAITSVLIDAGISERDVRITVSHIGG